MLKAVFLFMSLFSFMPVADAALSDAALVQECSRVSTQRMLAEGRSQRRTILMHTMKVSEIDNRRFNPWAFVYFTAEATDRMLVTIRTDKGPWGACH